MKQCDLLEVIKRYPNLFPQFPYSRKYGLIRTIRNPRFRNFVASQMAFFSSVLVAVAKFSDLVIGYSLLPVSNRVSSFVRNFAQLCLLWCQEIAKSRVAKDMESNELNRIFANIGIVKKGLVDLFITWSSSLVSKTDFEQFEYETQLFWYCGNLLRIL